MNGGFNQAVESLLSDPGMMEKLKGMASAFASAQPAADKGGTCASACPPKPPVCDDRKDSLANTRALLSALIPFLGDEQREKASRLLELLRIAEMAGCFIKLK